MTKMRTMLTFKDSLETLELLVSLDQSALLAVTVREEETVLLALPVLLVPPAWTARMLNVDFLAPLAPLDPMGWMERLEVLVAPVPKDLKVDFLGFPGRF